MTTTISFTFIIAVIIPIAILSYLLLMVYKQWANKNLLDVPNQRSSHTIPTPRGGGIVIVIFTLLIWVIALSQSGKILTLTSWLPWIGALAVAVTGWIDDVRNLSSRLRLVIHLVVAVLAVLGAKPFQTFALPNSFVTVPGWLGYPLTVLWIVGLINAYNFMDGIDGLAGLQAGLTAFGWLVVGYFEGIPLIISLSTAILSSSIGFLLHNWHPASIFMGDVASGFLGYVFALMPLLYQTSVSSHFALAPAILMLWLFLFDTILTFIRRLAKGEDVLSAHRSHLYQRLVLHGYKHNLVTMIYSGFTFWGLIFSVLGLWFPIAYLLGFVTLMLGSLLLVFYVSKLEKTSQLHK